MAEVKDEPIIDIGHTYSRAEQYIIDNQKSLMVILGTLVVLIGGFLAWKYLYVADAEAEARSKMFYAERFFDQDSLDKAINGSGAYPGFLEIAEDYSVTQSGNLANYYLGIAYLRKGEFEKAITYLKEFESDDQIISSIAKGAIGDANMELGRTDDAIQYYLDAAGKNKNDFTSPVYLKKAALAYEDKGQYKEALSLYEQIKNEFPQTEEGRNIERYLARARSLSGK